MSLVISIPNTTKTYQMSCIAALSLQSVLLEIGCLDQSSSGQHFLNVQLKQMAPAGRAA